MNNKLRTLLAFSALGMSFAALPVMASQSETLHVNVPFAFTAGKTVLPAGEYIVSETDSHVLMIRGSKASVLLLGATGGADQDEKSALNFERTSKGMFLRSIHSAGRPSSVLPIIVNEK